MVSQGIYKNIALLNGILKLLEYQERQEKEQIGEDDIKKLTNYSDYKAVLSDREEFTKKITKYLSNMTKGLKIENKRLQPKLRKINKAITKHLIKRYCDVELISLYIIDMKIKSDSKFNVAPIEFIDKYKQDIAKTYENGMKGIKVKLESLAIAKAIYRDVA
jgi:hypothetical protein